MCNLSKIDIFSPQIDISIFITITTISISPFYLNLPNDAGGVHPAGDIDSVAPDVVLRLLGADDPGHDGTDVDADADLEVVEGVLIDVVELVPDPQRVGGHRLDVAVVESGGLISQP